MPPRKRARDACRDAEPSSAAQRARLTIPCGDVAFRWAELTKMWREGSFLDCVVVVEGREFKAHRIVLAASSAFMKSAFTVGLAETTSARLVLEDLGASTFEALLTWCYDGEVAIDEDRLHDLLRAAARLQVPPLLEACENLLVAHLAPNEALVVWELGDQHTLPRLVEAAKAAVAAAFAEVAATDAFARLPAAWLEELLQSDHIVVKSEQEVFLGLQQWHAAQDPKPSDEALGRLLGCVRWALLDEAFLIGTVNSSRLFATAEHAMIMAAALQQALFRSKPRARRGRGVACVFSSAFDTNGALYHIATQGGARPYRNPHIAGDVVVSSSKSAGGKFRASVLVDHISEPCRNYIYCAGESNTWVAVDLGEGRSLRLDHYCLRSDNHATHKLRSWILQGTNDGVEWTTLRQHVDDQSLEDTPMSTAAWPVEGCDVPYRYFRIFKTGPNSTHVHNLDYLMCAGIELYGQLMQLAM
jgi:hypothetical protein